MATPEQNPEQELNQSATKPEQPADQAREVALEVNGEAKPEAKPEVTSTEVAGKVRAGAAEAMHVVHQRNQAYEGAIISAEGRVPTQVADAVQQPIETKLKPAAQQMEHVLRVVEQDEQEVEQPLDQTLQPEKPDAQSAQDLGTSDRVTNDLDVQRVVKVEPVAYELPSNPANLNSDALAQITKQQSAEQPVQQTVVDIKRPEDVTSATPEEDSASKKGPTIKLAA